MMTINDIKKALYKENPVAVLIHINKGIVYYETSLQSAQVIYFAVPVSDMGDASYYPEMEAKLLIRYINT